MKQNYESCEVYPFCLLRQHNSMDCYNCGMESCPFHPKNYDSTRKEGAENET